MESLVSIIMPSYKRNKSMVGRAIESLLQQSYKAIEIILVDDNAGKEQKSFRCELAKLVEEINSPRLVYIQNDVNLGGGGARNAGIEAAKGTYITFLDDDDRYLPDKISAQLEYMLQHDLDMSFTDLSIFDDKENPVDYREYSDIDKFDKENLLIYHLTKQITGTPTFMAKKQLLTQIGGFENVPVGQEYYLMMKIIESGAKIGYVNQNNVVAYRFNQEAISTGPNKIIGQKAIYRYKKSFFDILSFKDKQYIRCRHYAVMAVAYKRNKRFLSMLWNIALSVLCNPLLAIKETKKLLTKRKKMEKAQ